MHNKNQFNAICACTHVRESGFALRCHERMLKLLPLGAQSRTNGLPWHFTHTVYLCSTLGEYFVEVYAKPRVSLFVSLRAYKHHTCAVSKSCLRRNAQMKNRLFLFSEFML